MSGLEGFVLGREIVDDVAHAQSCSAGFFAISRPDSFSRGADGVFTFGGFVGAVENAVCGQDEVCPCADVESAAEVIAGSFQFLCFLHEEIGRDDTSVADDVDFSFIEDARWNGAQDEFLAVENDGVSSIGTAGETCYDIVAWGEDIDDFSFSFIAEDDAQQGVNLTLSHIVGIEC